MQSRLRRCVAVAGAGAVATLATLALNPFTASATGAATTTMTTVTGPTKATTGHAVAFVATVSPPKAGTPVVKATGTVSFTITGADASTVDCLNGDAVTLTNKAKAVCKVAAGNLLASATPYSVSADYSGDANFGDSSGSLSQTVTAATSHLKLTYDAKPTSGSATTFTATVTGGSGSMPTGTVQFAVSSTPAPGNANLLKCAGGNSQPLASNGATPPLATATCALSAKWFKVPTSSSGPSPKGTWTVTASYSGNNNFGTSSATKSGSSKV